PSAGLPFVSAPARPRDGVATLVALDAHAVPGRQPGPILDNDLTTNMSEATDKRSDTTREQILRAAAHQFAQRPYYAVGLDDILAEAQLTKGAMYFHFRSKHALALAIVDEQTIRSGAAVQELFTRKLSGLETLIDVSFLTAMADITEDVTRAAFNLLESVGRTEKLQERLLGGWIQLLGEIAGRGIREGDIVDHGDPEDIGRLLVSIYMGLRQASSLDNPVVLLSDFQKALSTVLRGIVQPDRIDYFTQFVKRRTALAIKAVAPPENSGNKSGLSARRATTVRSSPGTSRSQCRHRHGSAPSGSSARAHSSRPGGPIRQPCWPRPARSRRRIPWWAGGGRSHRTSATAHPRVRGRPFPKMLNWQTPARRHARWRAREPGSAPG